MRRRMYQIMRQHRRPASATPSVGTSHAPVRPAVGTTGKPLLLGAGLFAVFLALLFFSSSRSPSLEHSGSSSEKAATPVRSEPAVPTSLSEKRQKALQELRRRDSEEKRVRRAGMQCAKAVERDSGHAPPSSWAARNQSLQMSVYFTVDDPVNKRLFTSYKYACDASSGRAEITEKKVEVRVLPERRR